METITDTRTLSSVVASNVRAEAARRGLTQGDLAERLGMARITVSDRYRERTPWTLDETEKVAHLFDLEVSDLTARPKGFEPLTFWLGADHTLTVMQAEELGGIFWSWCDVDGCALGGWDTVGYYTSEDAAREALAHARVVHGSTGEAAA